MLNVKYYETYYFCNVISNILMEQDSYLRSLHDFHGDGNILNMLQPFRKHSVFHDFLEFVIDDVTWDNTCDIDLEERQQLIKNNAHLPIINKHLKWDILPIELALTFHGLEYESFSSFLHERDKKFTTCDKDDIYDYLLELRFSGTFEQLIEHTSKEVFHVLFQNRVLMLVFNTMMANALEREHTAESKSDDLIMKNGKLKRKNIPSWVRKAVYFRDRGRCVLCNKDLSGTLNLDNIANYDHIVPLSNFGFNDISNIQLLCKQCNQNDKHGGDATTSSLYQTWY
ncbi:HNH endonuclease [Aeromonas salmonicida]|uniref:HNH endonuclease n=1 Tax=Aeromonas salmonicida TaxID=645 RepID=UPI0038BA9005